MTIALFAKELQGSTKLPDTDDIRDCDSGCRINNAGRQLDAETCADPVLNTSLVCKEIISGTYHWNSIASSSPPPASMPPRRCFWPSRPSSASQSSSVPDLFVIFCDRRAILWYLLLGDFHVSTSLSFSVTPSQFVVATSAS